MDLPDLHGRVALITGGSRGIGRAIGSAFASAGAAIALVARDEQALDDSGGAMRRSGARVATLQGDVARRDFCFDAVARAERDLGPISVLVNAAGIQGPIGPIETLDPRELEHTLDVNLLGTVWMMQAVIPRMKSRHAGVILNLSGGGATKPRANFTAYAASKVAVVRLTETAALELAPYGVRVNAISPGAVTTRMTDEVERAGARAGDAALEELRAQRATGGVDPAVPAALAAWLASDAAAHVSGKLISAVWDDWRALIARGKPADDPEAYTLRRH